MQELFNNHHPYEQHATLVQHKSQNVQVEFVNLDDVVNNFQQSGPNDPYVVDMFYCHAKCCVYITFENIDYT